MRYLRHCRTCGKVGEAYARKSRICKECVDKSVDANRDRMKKLRKDYKQNI